MSEFQWIEDIIPNKIYEGAMFVVNHKSGSIMKRDYHTVIVIEITAVYDNHAETYSTSNVKRYDKEEKSMSLKTVRELVDDNYWQVYKGGHI